jgi:cadmium resistance transport/sequestration family protein
MELFVTSILAFASTNVDDIFILMLFFGNKEYNTRQIVLGQYLGIIALITISFLGSLVGLLIEQKYIGILGLLPIYFGVRGIIRLSRHKQVEPEEIRIKPRNLNGTLSVAGVTFANGGDNIGIYIPLFSTLVMSQKLIMIAIFLAMVAVWCLAAIYLSRHLVVATTIDKYGHIITPIVLICLGVYILYESGTFNIVNNIFNYW